jgi:hypothetical protein
MAVQTAINSFGVLPARFGFFSFEGMNSEPAADPAVSATPGSRVTMAATMAPSIKRPSWCASTSGAAVKTFLTEPVLQCWKNPRQFCLCGAAAGFDGVDEPFAPLLALGLEHDVHQIVFRSE